MTLMTVSTSCFHCAGTCLLYQANLEMPCSPCEWFKALGGGDGGGGGGGGLGVLGLIFAGYVPMASQNPYPIIVYYVAIL